MILKDKIFCAFDIPDLEAAFSLGQILKDHIGGIKLGLEFYAAQGPLGVRKMKELGLPIFLDLKLHDIPNTVARSVAQICKTINPFMLTIHTQGGSEMIRQASEAWLEYTKTEFIGRETLLVGVTVLTSLDKTDLDLLGVKFAPEKQVENLAEMAFRNNLDALVCSPHEVGKLKRKYKSKLFITPGIRPEGSDKGDQKRVMTPKQAVDFGADYLVIGRPITRAPDPARAAKAIAESLAGR